ncbi:MAG TPA: nuclear transport factor 2 family protein [Solirubrobacterales bacterium]|nr:nuclear transport factor 2 family protein [Solirubrobacterales bacterium]
MASDRSVSHAGSPSEDMLFAIEEELAAGDGDAYERRLSQDALVVLPEGTGLDREATVEAMNASPGWDEFALHERRALALGEDAALLTYRFVGRRGGDTYQAVLTSAYRRDAAGTWRLVHHQQTPMGPAASDDDQA